MRFRIHELVGCKNRYQQCHILSWCMHHKHLPLSLSLRRPLPVSPSKRKIRKKSHNKETPHELHSTENRSPFHMVYMYINFSPLNPFRTFFIFGRLRTLICSEHIVNVRGVVEILCTLVWRKPTKVNSAWCDGRERG